MRNHPKVLRLATNTQGKDYCVGDLHGMYDLLDKLLASVQFDKSKDRLISVGDLIDRGPASRKALIYLNEPWFYATRGNHEQLLMDCHENPDDEGRKQIWQRNGGAWWDETPASFRNSLYRRLCRLPIVIEIPTPRGLIGIVHADIPENLSWPDFTAALREHNEEITAYALWSRKRPKLIDKAAPVAGIHEIYCGHTIVPAPACAGNMHLIDTGGYLGSRGRLTLVDLHQGPDYRYSLSATK